MMPKLTSSWALISWGEKRAKEESNQKEHRKRIKNKGFVDFMVLSKNGKSLLARGQLRKKRLFL
jgi:hypothetical protein